jgi:hypothetical protein
VLSVLYCEKVGFKKKTAFWIHSFDLAFFMYQKSKAKVKPNTSLEGVWLLLLKFSSGHIKRLTFK